MFPQISLLFFWFFIVAQLGTIFLVSSLLYKNDLCSNMFKKSFYKTNIFFAIFFQLVVEGKYNYSDKNFQEDLENMLTTFENKSYMAGKTLTESWLRSFLIFTRYTNLNIQSEQEFVHEVKNVSRNYLQQIHFLSSIRTSVRIFETSCRCFVPLAFHKVFNLTQKCTV